MASTPESKSKDQTLAQIRAKLAQGDGAARKRRELDQTDKNRANKLKDIAKRLKGGEHVQNRMLKTWLTPAEYESIDGDWQNEKNSRISHHDKPAAVIRYEELLKQADFLHSRSVGYLNDNNKKQAAAFEDLAVSAYEDALASLAEDYGEDTSLQSWFDRPLDWDAGSDLDFNPTCMPRVITSRSPLKQSGGMHEKNTISSIKLRVVEQALDDLIFEHVSTDASKSRLPNLINLNGDELVL